MISCASIQQALSARMDGEAPGVPDDVIDAHVAVCPDCQRYLRGLQLLGRETTREMQPAPPDLSEVILADALPSVTRYHLRRSALAAFARAGLTLLALAYVAWGISTMVHVAIPAYSVGENSAFGRYVVADVATHLACAVGVLFAAWKPQVSLGLFPLFGAMFTFTAGFQIRDIVMGLVPLRDVMGLALMALATVLLGATWLFSYGLAAWTSMWRLLQSGPLKELD